MLTGGGVQYMANYAGWAAGKVPEIVQRRADGLWYSVRRFGEVSEFAGMARWLEEHSRDHLVRWVDPAQPFISASYYWAEQTKPLSSFGKVRKMPEMMTEDKARGQGAQLAQALCALFQPNPSANSGQVYALARTMANLSDKFRDDIDIYEAFTSGFLAGWQVQSARIVAPGNDQ